MFRYQVEQEFDRELKRVFGQKPEVLNMFLKHPRREKVIDNICSEIVKLDLYKGIKLKNHNKVIEMKNNIVKGAVSIFATVALEHAEQQAKSSAEKARINREDMALKDAQEHFQELEDHATTERFTSYGSVTKKEGSQKGA